MRQYNLTTIDNPHNPSTEYDDWFAFDYNKDYKTCSYLNRIVELNVEKLFNSKSFESLSPVDQEKLIDLSIDEIVNEDVLGIYIKVPINN